MPISSFSSDFFSYCWRLQAFGRSFVLNRALGHWKWGKRTGIGGVSMRQKVIRLKATGKTPCRTRKQEPSRRFTLSRTDWVLLPSIKASSEAERGRQATSFYDTQLCSPGCLHSLWFEIKDAFKCLIYAVNAGGNYRSLSSELTSSWFFFTLP